MKTRQIFMWAITAWAAAAPCAGAVSSRRVIAAIKRGVTYLLRHEKPGYLWEAHGLMDQHFTLGGRTALVTEALVDVQESLHLRELSIFKPAMARAIAYVAHMRTQSTYAASFQANALALLPNYRKPLYFNALRWDSRYLFDAMHRDGGYTYYWHLGGHPPHWNAPGKWDNSNTQYGILGQWAAAHAGVVVPGNYWATAARHWHKTQYLNGTWGYWGFKGRPRGRPERPQTMTPAGVASLLIADEYLRAHVPSAEQRDQSVVRGLRWIDTHINPHAIDLYEMYADERVGLATGLQYFGAVNWYETFAADLVKRQNANGSWWPKFRALRWNAPRHDGRHQYPEPIIGTAYALLILDRGLNPVVFNKLQYTPKYYGAWNARPRDAANLTSWMVRSFDAPLNWQVVELQKSYTTWLDSPILLITGSKPPHFNAAEISNIRHYVQAGGMVFCNCNDYSVPFRKAMVALGEAVCRHRYPAHKLAANNILYNMQHWNHATGTPGWIGISNGIRYLWIVSPADYARVWQQRAYANKNAWNLATNLYLYATGRGLLSDRLQSLVVRMPDGTIRRHLTVGILKYHGNFDPEPGAWRRMAILAARQFAMRVTLRVVVPRKLSHATSSVKPSALNARAGPDNKAAIKGPTPAAVSRANPNLLLLTGTADFALSNTEINDLRHYLQGGGMLFSDAGGGNRNFSLAFETLCQKLFPRHAIESLPYNSTIYTGKMPGGTRAVHALYRKYFVQSHGMHRYGRLYGVKIHGRWVIVFSPYDVTSGLLGTNTWGILGYAPAYAPKLARNILCYCAAH